MVGSYAGSGGRRGLKSASRTGLPCWKGEGDYVERISVVDRWKSGDDNLGMRIGAELIS